MYSADVLVISNLSRLTTVSIKRNSKNEPINILHQEVLVASVLGLRLCTPAFFSEGNFKAQNQFDNTVKMAPMIDTALYAHVTKKVKERHKVEWALLQFAFSV